MRRLVDLIPESRAGTHGIDHAKRFFRSGELPYVERFFAFSSPLERARREALYRPELRERVVLDSALDRMRALGEEQTDADLLNKILCIDQQTYMVDDLLTVADRTSMAYSLEVRVPFLDHPFVELMASVPGNLKIKHREKKYLLKRALEAGPAAGDPLPQEGGVQPAARALAARGPARRCATSSWPPRRCASRGGSSRRRSSRSRRSTTIAAATTAPRSGRS